MRKLTYSSPTALIVRWQRLLLTGRVGLLAGLALLLASLVNPAGATDFGSNSVIISGRVKGVRLTPRQYYTNSPSGNATQPIEGQSLGTFDRSSTASDSLFINAEATTIATSGDAVQTTQLFYRVFQDGVAYPDRGSFIPVNMAYVSGSPSGTAKWAVTNNRNNLVNFAANVNDVAIPATYSIELYIQSIVSNPQSTTPPDPIFDNKNGNNYTANFQVTVDGRNNLALQWNTNNSATNTNWFDSNNWTPRAIPGVTTDVTIPYVSGGTYPVLQNSGIVVAQVNNLVISTKGNFKARLTLNETSGLEVYGDFQDRNGGFIQTGGFLTLAGKDQLYDSNNKIANLRIAGGGNKRLTGVITLAENGKLVFDNANGAGIVTTGVGSPYQYAIALNNGARIVDESEKGYVLGNVTTFSPAIKGVKNDFGNIGLDLTTSDNFTQINVIRNTTSVYEGTGSSVSIQRSFALSYSPGNPNSTTYDLTFHYLNVDLNDISPDNLILFRSDTGDTPFENLSKTSADQTAKTVTRVGVTGSIVALYVLGDVETPLPVTLTSFTATATPQGGALLRWTTASETNNRGFNIERQVGTDGSWTTIGFVAAGSTTGSTYNYADKTLASAPASDKAYYRLRQEDLNGKTSYSPVAAITRQAAVAATEMTLSPVPVSGSTLTLTMAEIGQAGIEVAIINTQGQRLTNFTTHASTQAALDLPVASLAAGVYIVSVRVPGQATRHARFVKM